jgi:nucleoid-associated protein YgaU
MRWPEIFCANRDRIERPQMIYTWQMLRIPAHCP